MVDFEIEVLKLSQEMPVLVDFWAPWCGPCRVLGPVLDDLAKEFPERFRFVKINTEEQQQIAQEYNIRSIPNVKLFHKSQVVGEFTGALTKIQIKQFLDEHIPSAKVQAWEKVLAEFDSLQDRDSKIELLKAFLNEIGEHEEAKILLAKTIVFDQPDYAVSLVKGVKQGTTAHTDAEDIRTVAELLSYKEGGGDSMELWSVAEALRTGDFNQGALHIIEAVRVDKQMANELPRRAGVALFRLLGSAHEVTKKHRRYFDMALY